MEHKRWSKEMMEICGVKESQLAEIFESYETVGTLKPVSYTHLDVYKRQGYKNSCKPGCKDG